MRRRSTFVHQLGLDFNPEDVVVSDTRVSHAGLKAAREERLTYDFKELPEELQLILSHAHELHVRWASEGPYNPVAPFLSRTAPGLHIAYTPLEGHNDDLLCPLLRKVFSEQLKCASPHSTFTQPAVLSHRFAATASLQYYSVLSSLNHLVAYIQQNICLRSNVRCVHDAALLNLADTLDLDFDSISHTLTLTAFWSKAPAVLFDPISQSTVQDTWPIDVQRGSELDRVEVGILSSSPATDAHDLQLSGFLTVIGEDTKPTPTLFSFPSRHHVLSPGQLKQRYTVSVQQPQGLHPILQLSFPSRSTLTWPEKRPADSHCALQSYIVLPSYIFADEYAFNSGDPLFTASHNIQDTHSISGETDLEAPDYVVRRWGSSLLIEPAVPVLSANSSSDGSDTAWEVTIPLHLRYLPPTEGGQSVVDLPWPIVYWACTAEEGTKFPVNPFDRIHLGYEGLYGPRTMFYHLAASPFQAGDGRLVERLTVPVYDSSKMGANVIELTTLVVIVAGFLWVVAKVWPGVVEQVRDTQLAASNAADEVKSIKKE